MSPFVEIRKDEEAWKDYVFNIFMFFFAAFCYAFATIKAIALIALSIGVLAFIASLL
jgi:hypothetical protein